jgi:hypothetical protein
MIRMMTDVTVISADCAMTGDCMLTLGLLCGSMYPHAIPSWTDKPLWLDGHLPLVDKDYVSHSDSPLMLGSISI